MTLIVCRAWPLVVTLLILAIAAEGVAAVVCPVCGETFEDNVEVCPNDGTNLKLDGKEETSDSNAAHEDHAPPRAQDSPSSADEAAPAGDSPILYKRHDEDGERRIAPTKERSEYSDRESRLIGSERARAGVPNPKHKKNGMKKHDAPPAEADDAAVLDEFEKRRRFSWEERESARLRESSSKKDRETARRKLLSSLGAPIASLGGRIFWLEDDNARPDPVGAAEVDVNLIRYNIRAGFSTLVGIQSEKGDLVFLESLSLGMQWPSRFSPFLLIKGGLGFSVSETATTTVSRLLSTVGAEAGLDAWLHPWLAITPSLGYMRCMEKDSYSHTLTAKLAIGF
jgi:hypothetical protein